MKKLLLLICVPFWLSAQSFFVLSGITSYDPIVVNNAVKTKRFTPAILEMMKNVSREMGVDISKHTSRVLVFVINDVSLGDCVGLKVDLEVGEYVKREGSTQPVFGITYSDTRLIAPDMRDIGDVDDELADAVEEMLEKFKLQWQEDNRKLSDTKTSVTHENFAKTMGYAQEYAAARTKALKAGKPLLVFMTTSYCPWCRKLENRILSQDAVDAKIKQRFVPMMLNIDKDSFPKALGKTRFTPILYIVDPKNDAVLAQFTGYAARDDFLHYLKQGKQ